MTWPVAIIGCIFSLTIEGWLSSISLVFLALYWSGEQQPSDIPVGNCYSSVHHTASALKPVACLCTRFNFCILTLTGHYLAYLLNTQDLCCLCHLSTILLKNHCCLKWERAKITLPLLTFHWTSSDFLHLLSFFNVVTLLSTNPCVWQTSFQGQEAETFFLVYCIYGVVCDICTLWFEEHWR